MSAQDSTIMFIARARAGDRVAFDSLARMYLPQIERRVSARIGRRLSEGIEVNDIVQETLLRGFQSIDRFEERGEGSFLRWIGAIAEHVILEALSRQERRRTVPLDDDLASNEPSKATAQRREERFERLRSAIDSLAPEHREVIRLAKLERLPLKAVAERMGRTPEAVKQLLWRALQKLRAGFGDTDSLSLPDRTLDDRETKDGR
jgi:RNA polymerase sigma-70 factor (ECF subfamily)